MNTLMFNGNEYVALTKSDVKELERSLTTITRVLKLDVGAGPAPLTDDFRDQFV